MFDVNSLNTPIKRQRLSDWIRNPTTCDIQETHFKYKDTCRSKVKRQKRYITLTLIKESTCQNKGNYQE